ncbi:DNA primase [Rhizobium sp. EC-SD404]|uniref:DNA primase n=1 Tax=Rhizobium sp. EC-SD404 TaxID=2038389 RepID=UPI001255B43D|nr:DNA primase [Rhizobium sp. EC-SD404]VVT11177.1 DNA primase [Rhizobium sp. EC-SD404]
MRFSPAFLDEIRERVPISDVVGKRVSWDKRKTNTGRGDWWACCPFHGEKSPSFHCEDRKGRYHCFGCGVSGDHFRFLSELEGLSFPEAVERVADMAGIAMPIADPQAERRERERASLLDVMEMAVAWFQDRLQSSDGAKARSYLRDRGLTGRSLETFGLGYAPSSRNGLKEHLASKGIELQQMEACGLLVHGPDIPVSYDRFRDRIMFPILSAREKPIAFGGRAMAADAPAKYLNSNETELFHKGRVLYNFTRARRAAQQAGASGQIVAVEGYMDVIALHQAGFEQAVAPLGTALTEDQLELLWRIAPTPVLCFDGDGAGQRAAFRAVDLALKGLKPGRSVQFAMLPEGKDPDDLVRREGRAPFDAVLAAARPLADMVWLRELGSGSYDTPERRAELEARLKTVTAAIPDDSVRYHYAQDMRERMLGYFRAAPQGAGQQRGGQQGRRSGGGRAQNAGGFGTTPARLTPSDRLTRSALVRGVSDVPALRESALALTVVNHPGLIIEEFDEITGVEFDNADLDRLWKAILGASTDSARVDRERMLAHLEAQGLSPLVATLERQIRNARLWVATEEAALEDAREGFFQALSLNKRARILKWQKQELERDIAEATEASDGDLISTLLINLEQVQMEITRFENQHAIIDGFGVLSGRSKAIARV